MNVTRLPNPRYIKWLFAVFFLLISSHLFASHSVGIDLTYECLGGNQYRFNVNFYRDCAGIPADAAATISISSASCNISSSITLPLQSHHEISPLCITQIGSSTCNGGNLPGIEQYTYSGVYTFPAACTDWVISYTTCCRNAAITNLQSPGSQNLYVEAHLNNTNGYCDNSPVFTSLPVPYVCSGQPFYYNHGGVDIDGDSLVYSLVDPLGGAGAPIGHTGGFTATNPLTTTGGFNFDPTTGQMTFTPTGSQQAVVTVLVKEYRNGVLIGSTMRDLQVVVLSNCNNHPPTATGINGTNSFSMSICAGAPLCFNVLTNDVDAGNVVTLSYNNGIAAGSFTQTGTPFPQGTFCWTPGVADIGANQFSLAVKDNACPTFGQNTYTYVINVVPNPNPPVSAGPDVTLCQGQSTVLNATTTATGVSYTWDPPTGLSCTTCASPTASPSSTTIYTVTCTYPDHCASTDQVQVTVNPTPTVSVYPASTAICSGSSITLSASGSPTVTSYSWSPGGATGSIVTVTPATNTTYTVTAYDAIGCPSLPATSAITLNSPPPAAVCNNIYVTPTGSGSGLTSSDPTSLANALVIGACNNVTIKMAIGTYVINNAITGITSYMTLEGGFDPAFAWRKTSQPGAPFGTTIFRAATNLEGPPNAQRLVAIYLNTLQYFRFQDITIQTADAPGSGVSTYGVHMTACSNYNFVRTQIKAGNASAGANGANGANGASASAGGAGGDGDIDNTGAAGFGGTGSAGAGAGAGSAGGGTSTSYRAGGGGGNGGVGGSGPSDGTAGTNGGGVNGGAGQASGGAGGTWNDPGDPGSNGVNGTGGTPGTSGTLGSPGAFSGGFYVPGTPGTSGTDGQGGKGGTGGGGGGGQDCIFCIDGSGDGGGGGGGGGEGGAGGTGGTGGGAPFAVYLFNNGNNSNFVDCQLFVGLAGAGGVGGSGGNGGNGGFPGAGSTYGTSQVGAGGNGGSGGNGGRGGNGGSAYGGSAILVYQDGGTAPITQTYSFGLDIQPIIFAQNVSCTNNDVNFSSAGSNTWDFGGGANPQTASGAAVVTQYTTVGRKDINYAGTNVYTGFVNMAINNATFLPNITTSALPTGAPNTYYVCAGGTVSFYSSSFATAYTWDMGGGVAPNTYTTQNVTGLVFNTPGTYTISLQINTDCCGLSNPNSITLIVEPYPSITMTGNAGVCDGNSVTITAHGATSYSWSPNQSISPSPNDSVITFNPHANTNYVVTGYNSTGHCVYTAPVAITIYPNPTITTSSVSATCSANGTATVVASSGTPAYTYHWNDPSNQSTATATNLFTGNYGITVTDAHNCTVSGFVNVGVNGTPVAYIQNTTNVSCFGLHNGSITAAVAGGTGPFSYHWNNNVNTASNPNVGAGIYSVTITDSHGCLDVATGTITQPDSLYVLVLSVSPATCFNSFNGRAKVTGDGGTGNFSYHWGTTPVVTIDSISNVHSGTYAVTVTDGTGCTASGNVTVTSPSAITVTQSSLTNVVCNGQNNGAITVTASGGTPTYTYSLDNGAAQPTGVFTNLTPVAHTIKVTDAVGCDTTYNFTITQPALLSMTVVVDSVSCNGLSDGQIIITGAGGTVAYQYQLNGGAYQPSNTFTVAAGSYPLKIKDANGCTASGSATVYQPAILNIAPTQDSVKCFGASTGRVIGHGSGGSAPLQYSLNGGTYQTSDTFPNQPIGAYTVTVKDGKGCTKTGNITVLQPAAFTISLIQDSVKCAGGNNGKITVTPTGGSLPLQYSLTGVLYQSSNVFSFLTAGNYTVYGKDKNGCTTTANITVLQPPAVTAAPTHTNVSCNGLSDGTATVTPGGGNGVYTYTWSTAPVQNTATATGLAAGTYSVTVRDGNNCSVSAGVTITQPLALTATVSAHTNVACNGGNNGSATAAGGGGTSPYTYAWNTVPAQNTAIATSLAAGIYTVTVTDNRLCTATTSVTITEPSVLTAAITASTNVSCNAGTNGTATVTGSGGTVAYTYAWSTVPVQTGATANNLAAGTYTVTVKDANLCTASTSVTITQPTAVTAAITGSTNVTCNAGTNGTATVTPGGGTGAYTYAWSTAPVQTGATANNLAAGTYSVTVKDANLCTATASVTITQPTAVTAQILTSANVTCNAGNNGSATVTPGGGNGTYTYIWSTVPVQNTATASNLTAGTYSVTVKDGNLCSATASITITQPTAVTAVISASTNVSCNAGNNGSATVTAGGGTGGYTYVWSTVPVQNTAIASNLTAGTYSVTVKDGSNCSATASVTITEPTVLTATISASTNVSCNAGNNGSATATAGGGTTNYTYTWSTVPVQNTAIATGLQAGNYTVTVKDAHNCQATASVTITEPTAVTAIISASTNVSCNGGNNGSATVTPGGGTGAYTYTWSTVPVQNTAIATSLTAGTYSVTVKDVNLCQAIASVTITQPTVLTAAITNQTNVICNGGNNGDATVTAGGGAGGYTYTWSTVPVQNTATATTLTAGNYTVTVKDANNCTVSASVTITQLTAITASITTSTNVNCNGGNDGSATVAGNGGTNTFTYAWSTIPAQNTATATGLTAGNYTVTVKDGNNCTTTASVTITEPTALTASITGSTNVTCNAGTNGTATAAGNGGTTGYTYSWSTTPVQTNAVATGLGAGTYTVTVKDAHNCTATASVTITEPAAVTAAINTSTNITCHGGNNGSAVVTPGGGAGGFTYAWSTSPVQNTATATSLTAGNYSVTVKDASNCTATASVTITEPAAVTALVNSTNGTCGGVASGTATVTPGGGTGGYTFDWSTTPVQHTATVSSLGVGTYTVTVTDNSLCAATASVTITLPVTLTASISGSTNVVCHGGSTGTATAAGAGGSPGNPVPYTYAWSTIPVQNTQTATGLAVGTYNVTVTDFNTCTAVASVTLTEPTAVVAAINSSTNVTCHGGNDGSAVASGSGGTGAYTYLWSTIPAQTTATATTLAAGNYTVTVKDASNCTATASILITEPAGMTVTISASTNVKCHGGNNGSATVNAVGGAGGYSYSWSTAPVQTTATATGLTAGTYSVTVKDGGNCTVSTSVTITEPSSVTATVSSTNGSCSGVAAGTATVVASGGTPGYTYDWSTSPVQHTTTINGLAIGVYTVTVTDNNLCTGTGSATITQPVALTANITASSNILCNGANNGSATVTAAGGSPGNPIAYTYVWSSTPAQTTATASSLAAGNYTVTVKDGNNCTVTAAVTLTEPAALTVTTTQTNIGCGGVGTGTAIATGHGGTGAYGYTWSTNPVQNSATATNLAVGTYTVTVKDGNNCTVSASVTITQPPPLVVNSLVDSIKCFGASTGTISIFATGGSPFYTYAWTGSASTTSNSGPLAAGGYSVTVTDQGGCTKSVSFTLTAPTQLILTGGTKAVGCHDGSNGSAWVTATGATPAYTYQWSTAATTDTVKNLTANTYTVTVTDAHSCTASIPLTVNNPAALSASANGIDPLCAGEANGAISVSPVGGTGPFHYGWSLASIPDSSVATTLPAGNYHVTITDAGGCTVTTSATLTEPDSIYVSLTTKDTKLKFGQSAHLLATPSNNIAGLPNYTWVPDTLLSCNTCADPLAGPLAGNMTYTVILTDTRGCTAKAHITLEVDSDNHILAIPNVFSPNADGQNDVFYVYGYGFQEFSLKVFNRWGEMVYQTQDKTQGWDGFYKNELQVPGVYVYLVEITFIDGQKAVRKGSVTLIR